jgi:hypothetical protein
MIRVAHAAGFGLAALLAPAAPLRAQLEPLGDQFQVNVFIAGDQHRPDLGAAPDGRFLVAWRSVGQIDPEGSILARRFTAAGDPDGGEIPLDDGDDDLDQRAVRVAVQGDGDSLVGWDSAHFDTFEPRSRIEIARLGADGTVKGTTTVKQNVNQQITYSPPAMGIAAGDSFFAAWDVLLSDVGGGRHTEGRLFAADVTPAGGVVGISGSGTSDGPFPVTGGAAAGADGGFFVVWTHDPGFEPGPDEPRGRRIGAAGMPVGGPVILAPTGFSPAIAALPDGTFVVVWQDDLGGGSGSDVFGLVIAADGSPLGPVFPANSLTAGAQREPVVATGIGGFAVAWESATSAGDDDSGTSIQARFFDFVGTPSGADLQVNVVTGGDQGSPRLATAPNGTIVVAWESATSAGDDASGTSVQARLLVPPGLVFADGFEAGDLGAWSQARP